MKTRRKNQARLSWTPRRHGKIFCAPACGRGCTREEYETAKKEAANVHRRMKTRGWKVRVFENMGWHWCLVNTLCGMSLWPLHQPCRRNGQRQEYGCMMAEGDAIKVSHGATQFHDGNYYIDPNTAVRRMGDTAMRWFLVQYRGYQNLNSIFQR